MAIINSQVHVCEANTPKRPWHTAPNWPDHVTGDEMEQAVEPFRQTDDRLSNSERAMPMGGACADASLSHSPSHQPSREPARVHARIHSRAGTLLDLRSNFLREALDGLVHLGCLGREKVEREVIDASGPIAP